MKKIIICPKKSGNTYDVCKHVSCNSNIDLKLADETSESDISCYDLVFLASGVYADHVHKNILNWINGIDSAKLLPGVKFCVFLTWIGRGRSDRAAFNEVKRLLNEKGLMTEDNFMKCYGKMKFIKSSHPDEEDYNNALSWMSGIN